jgi:nitrite reductase/ring-hydroxylating ferredoxin subunit
VTLETSSAASHACSAHRAAEQAHARAAQQRRAWTAEARARGAGEVYAVSNKCTHLGLPIQGKAVGKPLVPPDCVVCPFHATKFSIKTGEPQGTWAPSARLSCCLIMAVLLCMRTGSVGRMRLRTRSHGHCEWYHAQTRHLHAARQGQRQLWACAPCPASSRRRPCYIFSPDAWREGDRSPHFCTGS